MEEQFKPLGQAHPDAVQTSPGEHVPQEWTPAHSTLAEGHRPDPLAHNAPGQDSPFGHTQPLGFPEDVQGRPPKAGAGHSQARYITGKP